MHALKKLTFKENEKNCYNDTVRGGVERSVEFKRADGRGRIAFQ